MKILTFIIMYTVILFSLTFNICCFHSNVKASFDKGIHKEWDINTTTDMNPLFENSKYRKLENLNLMDWLKISDSYKEENKKDCFLKKQFQKFSQLPDYVKGSYFSLLLSIFSVIFSIISICKNRKSEENNMETNNEMINKISSLEEAMVQVESEEIKYCHIQESSEGGYDYTFFDEDCNEIDGGIYEPEDFMARMGDALTSILEDETGGDYNIIRILSEKEAEEILEEDYHHTF